MGEIHHERKITGNDKSLDNHVEVSQNNFDRLQSPALFSCSAVHPDGLNVQLVFHITSNKQYKVFSNEGFAWVCFCWHHFQNIFIFQDFQRSFFLSLLLIWFKLYKTFWFRLKVLLITMALRGFALWFQACLSEPFSGDQKAEHTCKYN